MEYQECVYREEIMTNFIKKLKKYLRIEDYSDSDVHDIMYNLKDLEIIYKLTYIYQNLKYEEKRQGGNLASDSAYNLLSKTESTLKEKILDWLNIFINEIFIWFGEFPDNYETLDDSIDYFYKIQREIEKNKKKSKPIDETKKILKYAKVDNYLINCTKSFPNGEYWSIVNYNPEELFIDVLSSFRIYPYELKKHNRTLYKKIKELIEVYSYDFQHESREERVYTVLEFSDELKTILVEHESTINKMINQKSLEVLDIDYGVCMSAISAIESLYTEDISDMIIAFHYCLNTMHHGGMILDKIIKINDNFLDEYLSNLSNGIGEFTGGVEDWKVKVNNAIGYNPKEIKEPEFYDPEKIMRNPEIELDAQDKIIVSVERLLL